MTTLIFLLSAYAAPPDLLAPLPEGVCPTAADHALYGWHEVQTYTAILHAVVPEDATQATAFVMEDLPLQLVSYEVENGPTWATACLYAVFARIVQQVSPPGGSCDDGDEPLPPMTALARRIDDQARRRARTAADSGEVWAPHVEALVAALGPPEAD